MLQLYPVIVEQVLSVVRAKSAGTVWPSRVTVFWIWPPLATDFSFVSLPVNTALKFVSVEPVEPENVSVAFDW
jgi:hypothetical protein